MSPSRYSRAAIALHWLIAGALAFQLGLGWSVSSLAARGSGYDLMQLHKSVGIVILLLTLARVCARLVAPVPSPASGGIGGWVARMVHVGLYLFMLGAPLSGWLLVSSSSLGIPTRLFTIVPWPHLPLAGLDEAATKAINAAAGSAHAMLAWLGMALILLHVAGALRHQFAGGVPVLPRMLPTAAGWGRGRTAMAIMGLASIGVALAGLGYVWRLAPSARPVIASPAPSLPDAGSVAAPVMSVEPVSGIATPQEAEPGTDARKVPDPASPDPASVDEAATHEIPEWKIASGGQLGFAVAWGEETLEGRFQRWEGRIRFSPAALDRSSIRITIDLASARTGDADRDMTLAGPEFFATEKAADAQFTSKRIRALGGDRYVADGTLAMRGVARPISVDFTLRITGNQADAKGRGQVSRSAYAIGNGADYSAIADRVTINFSLRASH